MSATSPEAKNLFLEVTHLHGANVTNAQKTAENAIRIGVLLQQIKETVGHDNFLPAMAENVPSISDRCCNNYMRLASERLIEEKAKLLIADAKSATVADLTTANKSATVADLVPALPENAIPADIYEQARKEVNEMSWLKLPKQSADSIVKNVHGKDLMDLYREYGIVRAKALKVYHPPKKLTPDEKVAAENSDAEALLVAAERALTTIAMDLSSKTGILSRCVRPSRWKEFLRNAVTVTKAARPLTKRKEKSKTAIAPAKASLPEDGSQLSRPCFAAPAKAAQKRSELRQADGLPAPTRLRRSPATRRPSALRVTSGISQW